MSRAVASDGLVVIMDEAVADDFHAPADQVEQLMYGAGFTSVEVLPVEEFGFWRFYRLHH
jgi:hypothetical protein